MPSPIETVVEAFFSLVGTLCSYFIQKELQKHNIFEEDKDGNKVYSFSVPESPVEDAKQNIRNSISKERLHLFFKKDVST